jgi:osmotically-inducible protein OsmY
MPTEPDAYVIERIREALAHDPRLSELGINVTLTGDKVLLRGEVATPERKAAATEVVAGLVEGRVVHNGITVAAPVEAAEEEVVE